MVQIYQFKDGSTIKAFDNKPEFGRLIVATTTEEINAQGWLNTTTRVAFIKGKMADLEARFGDKAKGDLVSDKLTIVRKESTSPFYEGQQPKVNPSTAEVITHNGAPVYMQFEIAPAGTADVLVGTEAVAEPAEADLA